MSNYTEAPARVDQQSIYERVLAEFQCEHPTVVLTRFTKSNNTSEFRRQCLVCGECIGCVKKSTLSMADLDGMPDWDRTIGERRRTAWRERYEALRAEAEGERDREWQEWFGRYLRSPRWALKRQLVLEREDHLCQGCRSARAVEVHHTTYANAGNEPLFDLVALCSACHRSVHGRE